MSTLISEVSLLLGHRCKMQEAKLAAARQTYADGLLMEGAGSQEAAEAIMDAMDLLNLDAADLNRDFNVVREVQNLELQSTDIDSALRAARERPNEARAARDQLQGPQPRALLERTNLQINDAESAVIDLESHANSLRRQIQAAVAAAPRVFRGIRRLAPRVQPITSAPYSDASRAGNSPLGSNATA